MQHLVTISLYVDPTQHVGGVDTDAGASILVEAMLRGTADWPTDVLLDTPFTRDSKRTVALHEVDEAYEAMLADLTPTFSSVVPFGKPRPAVTAEPVSDGQG